MSKEVIFSWLSTQEKYYTVTLGKSNIYIKTQLTEYSKFQGNKNNNFWITTNLFSNSSLENILRIFSMTQSYKKKKNHMKISHTKIELNNKKGGSKKNKITSLILRP